MGRVLVFALALSLALSACGRTFEPPPDVVTLTSLSSDEAYAGEWITLNGTHFEQQPEANLVFFGSTTAEIDTSASRVTDGKLEVEVPVLADINELYSVTVSTTNGQAVLTDQFTYLGPGHPLDEQVHHLLPIETAPNTIAMVLPHERLELLNPALVTNTTSRTISLMNLDTGWHMDLGFPGQPMSAVLLPWEDVPPYGDEQGVDADAALAKWRTDSIRHCFSFSQFAIYATVLQTEQTDQADQPTLRTEVQSKKLTFVIPTADYFTDDACIAGRTRPDPTERTAIDDVFLPLLSNLPDEASLSLPELADGPWMPDLLQLHCLELSQDGPEGDWRCDKRVLAFTDYYRPLLAFARLQASPDSDKAYSLEDPVAVGLETTGSDCEPGRVGPVLDLTHVPGQAYLLAVAADRPELWRIDLGEMAYSLSAEARPIWPLRALLDSGLDLPDLGWDLTALLPQIACSLRFTALAASVEPGSAAVYLADATTGKVIRTQYLDNIVDLPGVEALLPTEALTLDAPVFALQAALQKEDGQRELVYAATERGLSVLDAGRVDAPTLTELGFMDLPTSRGGPGSLARYGLAATAEDDKVALADAARNQILLLDAGALDDAQTFLAGSTRPQVAASQWSDRLYVADPLSDTIRLIDQNTGLQDGKFLVQGDQGLGATGLRCMHRWAADLLLVPMANQILNPEAELKTFDRMVVRRAANMEELYDYAKSLDDRDPVGDQVAVDYQAHAFHEALVADTHKRIYLVQYAEPGQGAPGVVWPAAIDPSGQLGGILSDGLDFPDQQVGQDPEDQYTGDPGGRNLSGWITHVRLSSDARWLVFFGVDGSGGQPVGRIQIFDSFTLSNNEGPESEYELPPMVSLQVEDLAVWAAGERKTLFFSLPDTGMVLALQPGSQGTFQEKYIETTGMPRWLAFSPDHRRLYVTHRAEGKLSIIETGCGQALDCQGGEACAVCESLLATLPVEPFPDKVVFHPSGKNAYLTHEGSNVITVIE